MLDYSNLFFFKVIQKRLVCMGSLPFKADGLGDENMIYKQRLEGALEGATKTVVEEWSRGRNTRD